ncbi:MAG: DNA recombination protein RmuC [Actinomycetota bacterium]|nr:DNA recombination protein RmuC [Actinomycetota bacterium]MDA2980440.1 DNA recombination protein RmuC [Actinomycetota bacterium]
MNESVWLVAIALVMAGALGFVAGWVVKSRKPTAGGDQRALEAQLDMAQRQYEELRTKQEAENKILQALAPVSERLTEMQRTVSELEKQRSEQHGQISQQLRAALDSDELLRGTAEQLASALRSNSVRGVWGEVQLRRVVEAAGLIERVDFDVQSQISSDAGIGKPDMVIHLPGGKNIAVDAKVPFTAYLEASKIPFTATGEEAARREALLKQHVTAVRSHIDALGKKSYWDGLAASPELVICFIPSEALISTAIEADPSLMDYAFSKKVALASPVTLWSVLKTVAFSWQQDVLTEDAAKLFDVGKELLGRLGAMAKHIDTLGRSITSTVKGYNAFVGSLESRVFPSARKLTELGNAADFPDELEGIESMPRELSAPELTEKAELEDKKKN